MMIVMMKHQGEFDRSILADGIYRAIGHFVVEFFRMVFMLEYGILFAVRGNQQILRCVTAEMTADPLFRAWRSAMIHAAALSGDDLKVLSGLATEVTNLITLRNDWSHGQWLLGFGDTPDQWAQAALIRSKNSSKGLASPARLEVSPTAEYIEKVTAHTKVVGDALFLYGTIVTSLHDLEGAQKARPSDRVHIGKVDGRRQLQVSSNGTDWESSEWPEADHG
jgi:hypothetical protein